MTKLLGIIGDTHFPEAGPLWEEAYAAFRGVDLILHAGDLHAIDVLDWLEERCGAPVLAVRGNGDDGGAGRPVCPDDARVKYAQVIEVDGLRIGMTHDATLPEWPPHRTLETIMEHEFGGRVDIFVHGHTHVPNVEDTRGVLLVNPGSPTFPRNLARQLGTVALLEIDSGQARAWIHQLGEPVGWRAVTTSLSVRIATTDDAASIAEVEVISWRAAYRGIMPAAYLQALSVDEKTAAWARTIAGDVARGKRTLVVTEDGAVAGYAHVGRDRETVDGLLCLMYLRPQSWAIGAGKLLMTGAMDALGELGHRRAALWVLEANARARRFYQAAGWRDDAATRVDDYGGLALPALRMTAVIS